MAEMSIRYRDQDGWKSRAPTPEERGEHEDRQADNRARFANFAPRVIYQRGTKRIVQMTPVVWDAESGWWIRGDGDAGQT